MFDPTRQTLIVGLGKTGLSCARFLVEKGVPLAVIDSREQPPGLEALRNELPDVAVFVGGFDVDALAATEQLVLSPGVAMSEPALAPVIERGVPVIGDIEVFAHYAGAPVIAITGTNGKSTVTAMTGVIAQGAGRNVRIGGNIGVPALDLLRDAANDEIKPELYVLELSSFQLETTYSLTPMVAAVLNISTDHMDRYDSVEQYAAVKRTIYRGNGAMVINRDDPYVSAMVEPGRKVVSFGEGEPADEEFGLREQDGQLWLAKSHYNLLSESDLRVVGRHNMLNALAALAIGTAAGYGLDNMLDSLRAFNGLPHRTQWVGEKNGVNWYNDSKGTNVGATIAALNGMRGQVVLIAGGDGKGADFSPLQLAVATRTRAVILIGRDAPLIEAAIAGMTEIVRADSMQAAVEQAARLAQPGDNVLLSPACASFDMYRNYEERGEDFMSLVQERLRYA